MQYLKINLELPAEFDEQDNVFWWALGKSQPTSRPLLSCLSPINNTENYVTPPRDLKSQDFCLVGIIIYYLSS